MKNVFQICTVCVCSIKYKCCAQCRHRWFWISRSIRWRQIQTKCSGKCVHPIVSSKRDNYEKRAETHMCNFWDVRPCVLFRFSILLISPFDRICEYVSVRDVTTKQKETVAVRAHIRQKNQYAWTGFFFVCVIISISTSSSFGSKLHFRQELYAFVHMWYLYLCKLCDESYVYSQINDFREFFLS